MVTVKSVANDSHKFPSVKPFGESSRVLGSTFISEANIEHVINGWIAGLAQGRRN